MPTRKEERLKKLIQAVPAEAPAPEFTSQVMDGVQTLTSAETAMDPAMGALLRKNGLEMPPVHFTQEVMKRVAPLRSATQAGAPIIPVQAWYGIAAALAGLVVWATVSGSAAGPPRAVTFWSEAVRTVFGALSAGVQTIPALYVLMVAAVGVLLAIEYVLKYGRDARGKSSGVPGQ